jgi:hypothetical protein
MLQIYQDLQHDRHFVHRLVVQTGKISSELGSPVIALAFLISETYNRCAPQRQYFETVLDRKRRLSVVTSEQWNHSYIPSEPLPSSEHEQQGHQEFSPWQQGAAYSIEVPDCKTLIIYVIGQECLSLLIISYYLMNSGDLCSKYEFSRFQWPLRSWLWPSAR